MLGPKRPSYPRIQRSLRISAFSMLELLVVITIMTILILIGGAVISNSISQAKEKATRALLLKLDGMLQQRLDAFATLMAKPQKRSELQTKGLKIVEGKLKDLSIFGVPSATKMLMAYKEYFRASFPQTYADNPSIPYFNAKTNKQDSAESAEYLYWIITKSDSFGAIVVDDSEFSTNELRDTDGDGLLEFVDAWGQPLRFYRWPTRLLRPAGPGGPILTDLAGLLISGLPDASELAHDPDDAVGVYDAAVDSNAITGQQYESLFQTPDTYSTPLIVSAGLDALQRKPFPLGLFEPYDVNNFGHLANPLPDVLSNPGASALNDNLTNRQKQK